MIRVARRKNWRLRPLFLLAFLSINGIFLLFTPATIYYGVSKIVT